MKSKDLTRGNILTGILLFAIPIFIGNVLQQVYNLTDTWVVGKYLENGISAIGAANSIYDLLFAFANGMTSGFAIVIARAFGEKNDEKRRKSVLYTCLLTLTITLFLTVVTCSLMRPILHALNTPEEIFEMSYTYIMVITAGMITTMLYNMFTAMMRSAGNSIVALLCLIISVISNIGMDFLFVVGFDMGIFGAALATVVAQAISALACFFFIFFRMPELHITSKDFTWDSALFKDIILTGLSMGFMLSIVYIGTLVQQGAINKLGSTTITAHMLARKLVFLFMTPLSSMATASSTFAGQNYGAHQLYRIKKGIVYNIGLAIGWSLFSIALIYIFGTYMVIALGSLPSEDKEIIDTAMLNLKINLPFYPILSVLLIMRLSMQAIGYKITPSVSSGVELSVKLFIAYVFANLWGYFAICIGEPIIWSCCAIVLVVSFCITKPGKEILFSKKEVEA